MAQSTNLFGNLTIKQQQAHEQIADYIEEQLAHNALKEGEQLPSERELAAQFNVNRSAVRQAIHLLQDRGLVETKLSSGTYVKRIPNTVVGQSIERYFVFASCSHGDLMMLREILEPGIAAVAAQGATEEDVARLKGLVEQLESAYEKQDIEGLAQADVGFHEALATATHNELIVAVMGGLQRVLKTWLTAQAEAGHGRYEQATHGHRVIYDAVAARDPRRAREAMQVHLEYARTTLQG